MRFFIGIVAVLLSFSGMTAYAASADTLYQVREELVSQASDVRDAGLQQAFVTLVQRLTGQAEAAQSAPLAKYYANPEELISRYGYEDNILVVNFDPQTVQSALRASGLPIWGANRLAVLAWWQADDIQGLRLLSDGQAGARKLANAAQYYGVPARIPLGDLDEQLLVSTDALSDSQEIRALVERYTADAVLIVQQQSDDETLQAQWQLWIGDKQEQGQVSASSQDALASNVFAKVNEYLAQRFAIKPGQGEDFIVRVADVDLERFVLLERLLEPFAAQLDEVNQNYTQWQVRSSPEQLRSQMALAHLHERSMPEPQTAAELTSGENDQAASADRPNQADAGAQTLYFSW